MRRDRTFRGSARLALVGGLLLAPLGSWAADLAITELLASGGELPDEDGDYPDWIEIQNQGTAEALLEGWFLTDERADPRKWRFPAVRLGAGEYLVVFASEKDRAVAGAELHTNFQLSSEGEFLALVEPDGATIADAYEPVYPRQREDVSYGIIQGVGEYPFVSEGAAGRILVPLGDTAGDWRSPGYDDGAWTSATIGIGFDRGGDLPPEDPVDVAPLGTASQSSDGGFAAENAIDGEMETFTHTAAGQGLPATWELDLGDVHPLVGIVLHNRGDCCRSRLRDITVAVLDAPGGAAVWTSELLNRENEVGNGRVEQGPAALDLDLVQESGGPVVGRVVRVVRTPDPDLSGSGGEGNADEADVLSLAEVQVLERAGGFDRLVATDVEGAMRGVGPSLYLRIPFDVPDPTVAALLDLSVRYDAGFVAWLDGVEVARRNAPETVTWTSAATAERPDEQAVVAETIHIAEHVGVLVPGRNVLAIQAMNSSRDDEDFLILPELTGLSVVEDRRAYFRVPTPGAPNSTGGVVGFVEDTTFSHDRGFYDAPFDVSIATATEGAQIRVTLDGSPPTETNGVAYSGPIRVDRTTMLRARAFKSGFEPTNVDTHTYLFVDDVVRQDAAATIAAGLPRTWGSTAPDYGMDPDVVGPLDRYAGQYAATIRDDLRSIPAASIVLDVDDMFGSRGIYTNSTSGGIAWERPASLELIDPDRQDEFQVDCGVRIQGGYFRQHSATKKHSFRFLFKKQYGPARLRYPLFGPRAADEFDTLTFRAGANDGYSWDAARNTEQYARDEFGRSLQVASGNAGSHGGFVHLFINGIYWGLYNPAERPDHAFSATYYGGEKENWDSIHDLAATNGDSKMWSAMISQANAARTGLPAFEKLQGRNPDGSRNPDFPHLLDVPNYIDYLLVNLWGGNWDWPWKNWWAGRDRGPESTGFKFYCWDFENTMGNNRDRSPLTKNALQNDFSSAGQAHTYLSGNPEYKLLFGDRAHRLLFNGGILTPGSLIPRYAALADGVERAIVGESARWGDQHFNPPLTLEEWRTERGWILNTYLPQRSAIVLQQLRAAGLYPAVAAPAFSRHGGPIEAGFSLVIQSVGEVWYTLDGTDPRLPGGAVSPGASRLAAPARTPILGPTSAARLLVPADDSLGSAWTGVGFDDSGWRSGPAAIGFETRTGFESYIATDVAAEMYQINSTVYVRLPFDLDPGLFEGGTPAFAMLILELQYDDGYVAYLNGARIASRNAPATPAWNSRSTAAHADAQAIVFEAAALEPGALGLLRPGANVLAIQGFNSSVTGDDFLLAPRLEAVASTEGIVLADSTTVKARILAGDAWSALNEATFVLDRPLRITEIQYHPESLDDFFVEDGDLEFVELQNVGTSPLDLAGIRVDGGIQFDFSGSSVTRLAPGEIAVIVKDYSAFSLRYAAARIQVAGEYAGKLDNLGDYIQLRDPSGAVFLDVEFDGRWYPETDGEGPSLVVVDPRAAPPSWFDSSLWRPSAFPLGSPGVDESGGGPGGLRLPSDLNEDRQLNLSDAVAILGHLFLGTTPVLPCGDGTTADPANVALLDSNGDGRVNISDPVHLLDYLFLGGEPPVLGAGCVRIEGCSDACE